MSAASLVELESATTTWTGQISTHHQTADSLVSALTGHLDTWTAEAEGWIANEVNNVKSDLESIHIPNLRSFIQWCEQHPQDIQLVINGLKEAAEVIK